MQNGIYDSVCKSLNESNISHVEVSGIKPNPVISKVREAIKTAKEENVDAIIASAEDLSLIQQKQLLQDSIMKEIRGISFRISPKYRQVHYRYLLF